MEIQRIYNSKSQQEELIIKVLISDLSDALSAENLIKEIKHIIIQKYLIELETIHRKSIIEKFNPSDIINKISKQISISITEGINRGIKYALTRKD